MRQLIPPICGFLICLYLWVSLKNVTLIIGACWLTVGVLYGAWRTSFFTRPIQFAPIETEDETTGKGRQPNG